MTGRRPAGAGGRRPPADRTLLVRAALPMVAALVAVAVALPRPPTVAGDVCDLAVTVAQGLQDLGADLVGGPADPYGPVPAEALVALYRILDLDLLAEAVPADLGPDLAVITAFGEALLAADDAGRPPPPFDPALLVSFGALQGWYATACP